MSGLIARSLISCRILYWAPAQLASLFLFHWPICSVLVCPTCALSVRLPPMGRSSSKLNILHRGMEKIMLYHCYSLIFSELFLWSLKAFLKAPCSAESVKGIYYKFFMLFLSDSSNSFCHALCICI